MVPRTRKIWRGKKEESRLSAWSNDRGWRWASRREEEGHADGSFMQGAIVNQSRGGVSESSPWLGCHDRKWSKEKRGRGTINIVFATILGTSAARAAGLWASPREGVRERKKSFEAVGTCFMEDRFYAPAFVLRFISLAAFDFGHLETWRAPLRRRDRFRIGWWSRGCFARVKKGRIWCAF